MVASALGNHAESSTYYVTGCEGKDLTRFKNYLMADTLSVYTNYFHRPVGLARPLENCYVNH